MMSCTRSLCARHSDKQANGVPNFAQAVFSC